MAAGVGVLTNELRLHLFRVDISQVASKWIGETERNLRRVFDPAEEINAILLFDEADALFGKKTEVRDSHDRHANAGVSHLLHRTDILRGLATLATNMKEQMYGALLQRFRSVVQFLYLVPAERDEIGSKQLGLLT